MRRSRGGRAAAVAGLFKPGGRLWTPAFAGATITRSEGRLHVGPAFKAPERRDSEMEMHDPAHPGEIVREECLKPLGLTATAAAEALGVTRNALSDLLNGHTGASPDMAIRLGQVFGRTASNWLRMQMQ